MNKRLSGRPLVQTFSAKPIMRRHCVSIFLFKIKIITGYVHLKIVVQHGITRHVVFETYLASLCYLRGYNRVTNYVVKIETISF